MKKLFLKESTYYVAPFVIMVLTYALIYLFSAHDEFTLRYQRKYQTPVFTGFLTISGFLLSLKTLVVFKLHEGIYSKAEYLKITEQMMYHDSKFDPYESLKRLGNYLLTCVIATLLTSFSQLTIGQIQNIYASIFCISIAAGGSSFVLIACLIIRQSLRRLFDAYNRELKAKLRGEDH